jgi:hypothetical protein
VRRLYIRDRWRLNDLRNISPLQISVSGRRRARSVSHDLRVSCGDAFAAGHAMLIPNVPAGRVIALFILKYFAVSVLS